MTPLPESSDRKFPTRAVLAALGNKIENKQLLKESLVKIKKTPTIPTKRNIEQQ